MNGFVRPDRPPAPFAVRDEAIAVVMVVYKTGPALAESISRVLADPAVGHFVIIDNGSSVEEEAIQNIAARDPKVTLLRGHGNIGFAKGANMGARTARGDVLVFLNPDAFLQAGCVGMLKQALSGQPSPCIVGARVMNPDGTEQRGARRGEITPVTAVLSLTRLTHRLRSLGRFEVHHEGDPFSGKPEPVPTISGACFAARAADFERMGGFDESYFLHVEDVDLCWRARRMGGVVLFAPGAQVVHLGSTSQTQPVKVEFHKGVGLARYFRKRADNKRRRMIAVSLTPAIIGVSVMRALLNPRLRKAAQAELVDVSTKLAEATLESATGQDGRAAAPSAKPADRKPAIAG